MDWAFPFPTHLQNEFSITEEDGFTVSIYTAEFLDISISDYDFRANARLSKRQEKILPAIETRVIPNNQIVPVLQTKKTGILALFFGQKTNNSNNETTTPKQSLPSKPQWVIFTDNKSCYITYRGNTLRDATETFGYRSHLINSAANRGVLLSGSLLDQAFAPLERQLEELVRGIKRVAKEL